MSNLEKTSQKPKTSSLISNLLNRVDSKSLAIKKQPTGGVIYYFESENVKHFKANKDSLKILSYAELEQLINMVNLTRTQFTWAMFNLVEHIPEKKTETTTNKPKSFVVRGIKEVDKIGSNKFSDDKSGGVNVNHPKNKPSTNPQKRKRI